MATLLVLVGLFGFIFGVIRLIRAFFKKSPKKPELLIILGTFLVFLAGGYLSEPSEHQTAETKVRSTQQTKMKSKDTSNASEMKKDTKKSADEKNKQKRALISFIDNVKRDNNHLANLNYSGTQTIEINENKPTFSEEDLSLANKAWEKYGNLDNLNRATSAQAMLNQSLMPTAKPEDISNVKPTGWHNKKIDQGYLYNRSHLIGYTLSGENDNLKNLITGTAQLSKPEMLRYEKDIKYYLEKSKDNYVRYSVTPVFRDNELLARGVHLMAQSINSDKIKFNVYIFNIQDDVTLNYSDGTSQTKNEIVAAQQKEEERKNAEIKAQKAAEEQQRVVDQKQAEAAQKAAEEQQRVVAQEQAEAAQSAANEQQAASAQTNGPEYVDANGHGLIKGSNNGIYHVPGSKYYDKTTNPAAWFKTVDEAERAGYRAPRN